MKSISPSPMIKGAIVCAALAVLAACETPISTRAQTDPNVNLSSYHTYGFYAEPGTNRGGYTTPITGFFKNAVSREMNARGYKYTEESPDLFINFNTNARENVDVRTSPSMNYGVGYGGYYGYRGGMYVTGPINYGTEVETVRYKVGTANIDLVDAAKKQLVWEGIAEGKITDKMMKNPQATIDQVIKDLFVNYPIKGPAQ